MVDSEYIVKDKQKRGLMLINISANNTVLHVIEDLQK